MIELAGIAIIMGLIAVAVYPRTGPCRYGRPHRWEFSGEMQTAPTQRICGRCGQVQHRSIDGDPSRRVKRLESHGDRLVRVTGGWGVPVGFEDDQ